MSARENNRGITRRPLLGQARTKKPHGDFALGHVLVIALAVCSCADHASDSGPTDSMLASSLSEREPAAATDRSSLDSRRKIGTVSSVLAGIDAERTGDSRVYKLPAGPFGELVASIEHFDREGDRLSMVGRAIDSNDSSMMLKVTDGRVYGWVVYRDKDIAFEYTTDALSNVLVEQVPVSKVFSVCEFEVPDHATMPPAPAMKLQASAALPPHIGEYNGADITELESLPGAEKVWYINLAEVMNGSTPIGQSEEDVWQTWQSLAAILSAFQINVTTSRDVYDAAGVTNSGIADMVNIDEGSSYCGHVFGSRNACVIHRYRNGYSTGRILSHEVGHGLGLLHDGGDNGGEYFNGFSDFQWTPLMGNVWPGDRWDDALYQFSKGEYASATQQQDDLALINRHVEYREDDIPDTVPLIVDGTSVALESNWGQIVGNTDTDSFTFSIGSAGGHATLRIDRLEYMGGAMLDVDASIVDADGTVVAQHNAESARHAEFDIDLPAGDYMLVVQGGSEGTTARGFPRYSSLGFYAVEGTLMGLADTGTSGTGGMGGSGGMGGAGGTTSSTGLDAGTTGGVTGAPATTGGMDTAGTMTTTTTTTTGIMGASTLGGPPGTGTGFGGSTASSATGMGSVGGPAFTASAGGGAPVYQNPPADSSGCSCALPGERGSSMAWWSAFALAMLLCRRRQLNKGPATSADRIRSGNHP